MDKYSEIGMNPAVGRSVGRSVAHCLFEQSGTFKNEFIKLGFESYDYDILDDFGQTDFRIDLFDEIEKAYNGRSSVFDGIEKDDITIAFFPCTMFQENNALWFSGNVYQLAKYTLSEKMDVCIKRHENLHLFYTRLCQMTKVFYDRGLKLIIENPGTEPHYLTSYWIDETLFIKDRRIDGDWYKKPTKFWFINCTPSNNFLFEPIEFAEQKIIERVKKRDSGINRTIERSLIHPQFANRFIRQYII